MHECGSHACVCTATAAATTTTTTTQTLDETLFTAERSLHHAVADDRLDRVVSILSSSSHSDEKIRTEDSGGWAAVLYARSCAMLRLLGEAGADLHAVTPAGRRSMLHRSVVVVVHLGGCEEDEDEAADMIALLLQEGVTDKPDADGMTAHQLALKHGKTRLAALLSPDKTDVGKT